MASLGHFSEGRQSFQDTSANPFWLAEKRHTNTLNVHTMRRDAHIQTEKKRKREEHVRDAAGDRDCSLPHGAPINRHRAKRRQGAAQAHVEDMSDSSSLSLKLDSPTLFITLTLTVIHLAHHTLIPHSLTHPPYLVHHTLPLVFAIGIHMCRHKDQYMACGQLDSASLCSEQYVDNYWSF